jgi:hypothetical protein
MDWYWNLSSLLLDENMTKERPPGLHSELEMTVTQLYSKLLLYQMKSVCYCHRKQFSVFLRDLIKLDDWGGELSDIQAAEAVVQADSAQYNTLRVRARLDTIAETAKSQNMKLDSISLAIREQTKQQEKMYKTSADNTCLADLRLTDPRDDKKRIEETKGGLLKNSYYWILDNLEFQQWRDSPQNQLLWVKADPGKGKTMLLCGIIDELQKSMGSTALLSFFFCQATDLRINNATAVLRGLMYLLVDQQPSLISHLRKKHDHAGKSLFEDANAWVAMSDIFTNMLKDPNLSNTYIVVDALDECVDLPKLLDLIVKQSSAYPRVKWLVSSRNWPTIEEQLEKAERRARLSLELNADSVSAAVGAFIQHNVMQLAQEKKYDDKTKQLVQEHLSSNANGTFLWVALVCQVLRTIPKWKVPSKLTTFPSGLDSLYGRMMSQINSSDDADLCKQMLASIAVAYRPLKMQELACLVELENLAYDLESLRDIIGLCGSFLTIQDGVVYLVHQSAKDYLIVRVSNEIFPSGREDTHYTMFFRSLRLMSSTLRRDMYNLGALGYPIEWVESPERDPLATVCYSCVYWVDHLEDSNSYDFAGSVVDLQDGGALDLLLREKYLYWLEALSLCKNLTKGVASIAKLEALVQVFFKLEEPSMHNIY